MKLEAHRPGWVYILTNSAMPGDILKIGLTQVDCLTRMRSIAAAHKIPGEWRLEHHIPVLDAFAAEQAVHRALDAHRLRWEFFQLPLAKAIEAVERITAYWTCAAADVLTPAPIPGLAFQVADRAAKAKAAGHKAAVRRKRRQGARKAVATRLARAAVDPLPSLLGEPTSEPTPGQKAGATRRRRAAARKAVKTREARASDPDAVL